MRKFLVRMTTLIAMVGIGFVIFPFAASLPPSQVTKNAAKVLIPISSVPVTGALEIDYQWYKALVVRNPEIEVFLMPFEKGVYFLPDPTWNRPLVPCNKFEVNQEGFSCNDPELDGSWNEQATWNLRGESQGTWMPDIQKANFRLEGANVVLSPEYD